MPKSDFVSKSSADFSNQLNQCKAGLVTYGATLGLSPAQIQQQSDDADYYDYLQASQQMTLSASQEWTAWKKLMRDGGANSTAQPQSINLPAVPPTVPAPGIEVRFRALVKFIKASPSYNVAIGEALGIEGSQQTGPDLSTVQPVITAALSGNQVNIGWGWQGNSAFLDMCELQVDRGSGWTALAHDTTTPRPTTPTPPRCPPPRPNGNTAPSTAWATRKSASGATR